MYETTVTLCGRLVADPELRQTSKGNLATMRVAVNERKRESGGGYSDGKSSFYSVSAWGELGGEVMDCLSKGNRVVVHGILRVNGYQSDGRNLERVEVTAENIGPDLRFGTAYYRPRPRGSRGTDHAAPSSVEAGPGSWTGRQPSAPPTQEEEYTGPYDVVDDSAERTETLEPESIGA
ncbi:single-strand DNA-binding protein [Branchiibius hedensis]|uniref:Single-stranded DNA-binding protein n=1 Tax=Branchiibius hedensis TaxID=672460 RepID=A0A2Y8ZM85_9MICO|nr:single-stranded DNA-binding protein [Branchiibius hedensis]PWJ24583.1 single-strand DNA-binding protein [Branchiibius hedensis]SSA33400.1 single-strand DNA-binding protein [Branchiibius hedensis]